MDDFRSKDRLKAKLELVNMFKDSTSNIPFQETIVSHRDSNQGIFSQRPTLGLFHWQLALRGASKFNSNRLYRIWKSFLQYQLATSQSTRWVQST